MTPRDVLSQWCGDLPGAFVALLCAELVANKSFLGSFIAHYHEPLLFFPPCTISGVTRCRASASCFRADLRVYSGSASFYWRRGHTWHAHTYIYIIIYIQTARWNLETRQLSSLNTHHCSHVKQFVCDLVHLCSNHTQFNLNLIWKINTEEPS